ncbi:MAG: DUF3126 family protein [Rhodospirillales bacterium]|nr:DUF3126 family protein [Rhodospirillales bacterium]MCB9996010.1 DUF3126 family protein [Rhodospirillales bacterium]
MTDEEMSKLQRYMQDKFSNGNIVLRPRSQTQDSVEVLLNGEFIGVIYKDDEDAEDVSYDFNMAILKMDLDAAA